MTSTLILEPQKVPLTLTENDVWRVTGTRIPLERVIECYRARLTPEDIVDSFDSLKLSDVYAIIGYYLDHKEAVEQYLRRCEEEADKVRKMIEARQPPHPELREELLGRKARREANDAEAGE